MSVSPINQSSAPLPHQGERWIKVTEGGLGLAVEIIRVTELNVQFRVAQGRTGRVKSGDISKMPIRDFAHHFVLANSSAIRERQERLRLLARQGGQAAPSGRPRALPPPAHVTIADNGTATCTCADFVDRCGSDAGYACDHIDSALARWRKQQQEVAASAASETDEPPGDAAIPTQPDPTDGSPLPLKARGGHPKLTDDKAVEVFQFRGAASATELAATYGVSTSTINKIWQRRAYAWATAHLTDATGSQPTTVEGDTVSVPAKHAFRLLLQERKVESRRTPGRYYSVKVFSGGICECSCTGFKNDRTCWHARALTGDEPVTVDQEGTIHYREQAPKAPPETEVVAEAPWTGISGAPPNSEAASGPKDGGYLLVEPDPDTKRLLGDMADYLETLAQYAGQPLPKLFERSGWRAEVERIIAHARSYREGS